MRKLISGFSITGKKENPNEAFDLPDDPDDPFAGMDEAKAATAMRELEGAIEGMDEDNPDPRQMGRLMRRMCELTGESMDEPMEEVVRKLEEGMNPDELEDRMGDVFASLILITLFSPYSRIICITIHNSCRYCCFTDILRSKRLNTLTSGHNKARYINATAISGVGL